MLRSTRMPPLIKYDKILTVSGIFITRYFAQLLGELLSCLEQDPAISGFSMSRLVDTSALIGEFPELLQEFHSFSFVGENQVWLLDELVQCRVEFWFGTDFRALHHVRVAPIKWIRLSTGSHV
jgi:hypothetical protein